MLEAAFLVTEECARLARWLRLCGYDAVLAATYPLSELYQRAYHERRVVVTRNRRVTASCLFRVVHLDSTGLDAQMQQLMHQLHLTIRAQQLFTRCDRCNIAVEPVDKTQVQSLVPPYVFQTQQTFHACPSCHRIYWAATHWQRACRWLDRLREEASHA